MNKTEGKFHQFSIFFFFFHISNTKILHLGDEISYPTKKKKKDNFILISVDMQSSTNKNPGREKLIAKIETFCFSFSC